MSQGIYNSRSTKALINFRNLKHNVKVLRSLCSQKTKFMAMVKADAYGHNMVKTSQFLEKECNVDYFGVACLEEAILLRKHKVTTPILVVGAMEKNLVKKYVEHKIDMTIPSLEIAKEVSNACEKLNKTNPHVKHIAQVHLKIDTGMNRIGTHWNNAETFLEEAFKLPNLNIVGIFSHFAKSGDDEDTTRKQIEHFEHVVKFLKLNNLKPTFIHLSNSDGTINYPEAHYDIVRCGIALYGYCSNKEIQKRLKPVMTVHTRVTFVKTINSGDKVSYGHTFTASEETKVATLPIGYGDGYSRCLSNNGIIKIKGKEYRVVGKVCMDQTMIKVEKDNIKVGDKALVFGEYNGDENDLNKSCQGSNAITYEIITNITKRVPRVYVK